MDDTNNKNNKINKILATIIVVLIIIIFLLLLKGCSKDDGNISHEGKVNVFEIKCDVDCECNCEQQDNKNKEDDKNTNSENNKDNKSNDNSKEVINIIDEDDNTELDIKVLDNNKTWKDQENINIFNDSTYVVKGKIAPESTGTYQFIVKNSTKYNVKYNVTFSETNNYHINMKYKLKKNNEYIIEDWVTYSELAQSNIRLNTSSSDTYYLEWKWFSSSNDNSIGEDINSKYGLSIEIRAVQAND